MPLKSILIENIQSQLATKKAALELALSDLQTDKQNESKSSAGDKYETSREMMQQSENRIEEQLNYTKQQIRQVSSLNSTKNIDLVENGALVETNQGYLFFGISLGKYIVKEEPIFVLSLNAPLGKALKEKKAGAEIQFQDKTYKIKSIT